MTDRRLDRVETLGAVSFDDAGLAPVVAQDLKTGSVLMVAWADREALVASLETGFLHFHSRSRDALWKKGETSGHVLGLEALYLDCDGDTVLALVVPAGPACHTGETTCFGDGSARSEPVLDQLDATLEARAADRPTGSYTVRLLDDTNLRLKKLGEEAAELVAALATEDGDRATEEAADLVYHVLVGLRALDISASSMLAELERRSG